MAACLQVRRQDVQSLLGDRFLWAMFLGDIAFFQVTLKVESE
jgi:hypothetical protein